MARSRWVAVAAALTAAASCGGPTPGALGTPTAPAAAGNDEVVRVDVVCPTIAAGQVLSLFVGQNDDSCDARATFRSGSVRWVGLDAVWSPADPAVASVVSTTLPNGITKAIVITGLSGGQTTVTASYFGRSGSQQVEVKAEDYMFFGSSVTGGAYTPGSTSLLDAIVRCSVASDATGQLRMDVSDQSGVVATASTTLSKGYGISILHTAFVVPEDAVTLCPTVTLVVGTHTFIQSPREFCVSVVR